MRSVGNEMITVNGVRTGMNPAPTADDVADNGVRRMMSLTMGLGG